MKFEVNTTTLSGTVNKLSEKLEQINAKRMSMYNALNALNGMWQGDAKDAFTAAYEEDNELMVALIDELEQYIDNVSKARENYDTTEDRAVSLARSIKI